MRLQNLCLTAGFLSFLPLSSHAIPILGPNGHYYEIIPQNGITWDSANNAAGSSFYLGAQGHLATSTSAIENAFLASINQVGQLWLGGYQQPGMGTKDGWSWVNGEGSFPGANGQATFANWAVDEPNDFEIDERYLTIGRFLSTTPATWNDEGHLEMINGYVVEYYPVPDAAPTFALLGLGLGALAGYRWRWDPGQQLIYVK